METTRQQKINRLIQKELSEILRKDAIHLSGVIVTVTGVRISPDLSIAKVYLSFFPSERGQELLKALKTNAKTIRFDLGKKMGKQLRVIPELLFFLDDSLDYVEKIDALLKQ